MRKKIWVYAQRENLGYSRRDPTARLEMEIIFENTRLVVPTCIPYLPPTTYTIPTTYYVPTLAARQQNVARKEPLDRDVTCVEIENSCYYRDDAMRYTANGMGIAISVREKQLVM